MRSPKIIPIFLIFFAVTFSCSAEPISRDLIRAEIENQNYQKLIDLLTNDKISEISENEKFHVIAFCAEKLDQFPIAIENYKKDRKSVV